MTNLLGSNKQKIVFASQGVVSPDDMIAIALQVIKAAGMTPAREPRVDTYPYLGAGGQGYTLYQPLMESYLVADVYTDLGETEILISTCKPERMNKRSIRMILTHHIGPTHEVKL